MAAPSRSHKQPPTNYTQCCPTCGHVLVQACTHQGQVVLLDTQGAPTWVITGRTTAEGWPIIVPSRGYLEHPQTCGGV